MGHNDVRRERDQFRRMSPNLSDIGGGPARIDPYVATYSPTQQSQPLMERCEASLEYRIACGCGQEHADAPHAPVLLRPRCQRPHRCPATEQSDELAAPHHSITRSARSRIDVGNSIPIALAVMRLTISSNFVGCSTGRAAGLIPSRILWKSRPLRRYIVNCSTP